MAHGQSSERRYSIRKAIRSRHEKWYSNHRRNSSPSDRTIRVAGSGPGRQRLRVSRHHQSGLDG